MQPRDAQVELLGTGLHLVQVLVPDPEAAVWAAGCGALGAAAAVTRVYPHRDLATGRSLPHVVQLLQRTGIVEHAAAKMVGQPRRRHLGRELDGRRREAGTERALDLVITGRVQMQPHLAEYRKDAAVGISLHGVA